jgi:hypothetical protein
MLGISAFISQANALTLVAELKAFVILDETQVAKALIRATKIQIAVAQVLIRATQLST